MVFVVMDSNSSVSDVSFSSILYKYFIRPSVKLLAFLNSARHVTFLRHFTMAWNCSLVPIRTQDLLNTARTGTTFEESIASRVDITMSRNDRTIIRMMFVGDDFMHKVFSSKCVSAIAHLPGTYCPSTQNAPTRHEGQHPITSFRNIYWTTPSVRK